MRIANVGGRLSVLTSSGAVDVHERSAGRFASDPAQVYDRWNEFRQWAAGIDDRQGKSFDEADLHAPSPCPRQVFAIGLNYAPHAVESGFDRPTDPLVFTKFRSSIAGASSEIPLPSDCVDWEVELVAVIGRPAAQIAPEEAWSHIAGLTIGQDFSERDVQTRGQAPQYSLGKSFPNFGPIGPWLVTPEEFADPNDLAIECSLDGELVQRARTSQMIFPIAELVAHISRVCVMLPGDLLFTGTPEGTGFGRTPPRYLQVGERVVSRIEGIGTMQNLCVSNVSVAIAR